MRKIILLMMIILLLAGSEGKTAFSERFSGARPLSMGGSFAALADDLNSIYYNPAGLSLLTGISISGLWTRYYGMEELEDIVLCAGLPTQAGSFAGSYQTYGFDLYRESSVIISHGLHLFRVLSFGYNVKYLTLSLKADPGISPVVEYGSDSAVSFDFGIKGDITGSFSLGAFAMNVNSPSIGKNNAEESEQKFCISAAYRPVNGLATVLTFDKAIEDEYRIRAGAEMWLYRFLALRTGVISRPFNFSVGLGLNYNILYVDYAMVNNLVLGQTHVFSLSVMMGRGVARTVFTEKKPKSGTVPSAATYYTGPKVNINTATAEELGELPRVGPKMAAKIIEHRTMNGPFRTIEELKNVKGIGDKTFERMRNMITTGEDAKERPKSVPAGTFDINTAQLKDFVEKGVSPLAAIKVIKYRDSKGGIRDLEELKLIEGLSAEEIARIRALAESK